MCRVSGLLSLGLDFRLCRRGLGRRDFSFLSLFLDVVILGRNYVLNIRVRTEYRLFSPCQVMGWQAQGAFMFCSDSLLLWKECETAIHLMT
jgi:hypothetical protein